MKFENLTRKERYNREIKIKEFVRRLRMALKRMFLELADIPDFQEQKRRFINRFSNVLTDVLPEQAKELQHIFKEVQRDKSADSEGLINVTSRLIGLFVGVKLQLSPEELERRLREYKAEWTGERVVNRVLTYEVDGNEIYLHIPLIFIASPMELKALFTEGLRKLAHEMKNDETLSGIQKIKGDSWLVFKNPKLVKGFGFTVTDINEKQKTAIAEIERSRFLEIYD